ncbi:MAG: helix-turn-helix transcriptional regulator [Acidobacteriaceae bacterium]
MVRGAKDSVPPGRKSQPSAASSAQAAAEPPLIRPRDAASLLGLSYPTLKQWIYKGKIHAIKTAGGHYRIAESELDRFLFRKNERAPVAERRIRYRNISARNQLVGRVSAVTLEGLLAQVQISIGGSMITSIITAEAVREMRLRPGDTVAALIKSTSIMIERIDSSP